MVAAGARHQSQEAIPEKPEKQQQQETAAAAAPSPATEEEHSSSPGDSRPSIAATGDACASAPPASPGEPPAAPLRPAADVRAVAERLAPGREPPPREPPRVAAARHARAVVEPDDPPGLEAAVARELERDLAAGRARNPGGLARAIAQRLRANPADIDAPPAGPPTLSPQATAYRAELLERADAAMNRREDGTADALRRLARLIREQGDAAVPDETPEEVEAREREHRRALALAAQEVA